MVEFFRKFQNRGIKIARVNLILITQFSQFTVMYFNFVRCWGKAIFSAQSLNREVCSQMHHFHRNLE